MPEVVSATGEVPCATSQTVPPPAVPPATAHPHRGRCESSALCHQMDRGARQGADAQAELTGRDAYLTSWLFIFCKLEALSKPQTKLQNLKQAESSTLQRLYLENCSQMQSAPQSTSRVIRRRQRRSQDNNSALF